MAPPSSRVVVEVDLKKKPWQQSQPLHNRWHPEIPTVAEVKVGEFFRVEMIDAMGGVVKDNDSAVDIKNMDLTTTHHLSGPIRVVDEDGVAAKTGDLLAVEICNLGPLPGDEWGFTASFDRENGGGFLTDHFPCATKAIWYFEGIYAYSPQIPGVRFPGLTHPGVIGTAPSKELLSIWNERERKLEESGPESLKLCEVVHQRPLSVLPTTKGCLLGNIEKGTPEWERIANEAARTIPGRENGGNCDIKNLSRGSKIYLPVFVEGANLSTGDMHFSQGDGEISFCGAIEMSGFLELKCEIIRNGMQEYLTPMGPTALHVNPIFEIGPVEPRFSEWLVFEGISVDESGRQHYLDATVAYKRAVLNAIDYLFKFGYSKEQVYLLLSCCPCEGRISGIVDSPNAVATLAIPTAIFDQLWVDKVFIGFSVMAPVSPRVVVKVDLKKRPWQQSQTLHNRWHPEIPSVAEVKAGELFRVEMVDWTGGAIKDDGSADDIKSIDLSTVHYLSGPIKVVDENGVAAKPGDLLAVEICNLGPLPGDEWGFTGSFDRENGGGFLTDHFPCATKAIWYFEGIYAYSPQIPGVRFPGLTHPGIIGTAPSKELLRIWNGREKKLEESGTESLTLCEVVHQRPLANLPTTKGCLLGNIEEGTPEWERIAKEGARTIPGRENGGNCDIKNLSRGSKIYLPVFVEGANLSTGDMHFSQGDGEISFCGAIEMSGFLELKCEIIRNGMQEYLTPMGPSHLHVNPIFEIGPVEPRFSEWLVFEGISVDESGRQHYLDATVAYKRAVLNAIDYLFKFGYSKEQVYLLLSCCPCEGRISGIVDSPNAVATLAIPTAIFDQDIRPKTQKVPVGPRIVRKPDVMKSPYDGKLPITKNPSSST